MAAFQFSVQQISFASEDLPIDSSSLDSLSSVVDPNVDFIPETKNSSEENEIRTEEWKSTTKSLSNNKRKMITDQSDPNLSPSPVPDGIKQNETVSENIQASYPTIPIAVAHRINQNNPELCQEAGKYFYSEDFKNTSDLNRTHYTKDNIAPSTPLHSMSATSEALALQHSVIGNLSVKPVSPDIVAQVVAKTKLQLEQRELNPTTFSTNNSFCNIINQNGNNSSDKPENVSKVELIRYPSEVISSTVEKRSWFSNSSSFDTSSDILPKTYPKSSPKKNQLQSRSSSQSSINSMGHKRSSRTNGSDLPTVHSSKALISKSPRHLGFSSAESPYDQYLESSVDYETESSISEKFELESLCSEAFETESMYSEVSGVDDEMFQIRRLLETPKGPYNNSYVENKDLFYNSSSHNILEKKDVNTSPLKSCINATCDKAIETDEQSFQLLREKASLEGRLESVTREQSDLIKERDYYSSLVGSYEVQIKSLQNQLETSATEKKNALLLYEAQTREHTNWDNIIKEYQDIIETKNAEIKALKEDLSESEQTNIKTRIGCEEIKVDLDSREGAITGLKKKIAELHVEVQIHLQGKIQLENEVKNVRLEMDTLQKSKDWFQEQLHSAQENRNKLYQQLIHTQNELTAVSNNYESLVAERNQLKLELAHSQQRAVAEKEILMKRLETIEADMKERESLFDEMQKDKGSAENSLIERIRKMEEEKSQLMGLSFTVSDQEYQLKSLESNCEEKTNHIKSLEKEKANLNKHIAILQKSSNDKNLEVQQLMQQIKDLNVKLNHLEIAVRRSEDIIHTLKEEKTATDVALSSANEEKRIISESLKTVSENLNRFTSKFKQMKSELLTQTSRADQLFKEKTLMEEVIKRNEESLKSLRREFEQKMVSENQNRNVMFDDLQKKKTDVESVLNVYSKDLLNYQQQVESLMKEKALLTDETSNLKQQIRAAEERIHLLEENVSIKGKVFNYEKQQNNSDVGGNELDGYNDEKLIKNELQTSVHEQERKMSRSKALLYKKLKEKIKECKMLKDQLIELRNTLEENISYKSNTELSNHSNCINCESRIAELEHQLNQQNQLLEEKILQLKKNEDAIIELEKERGKAIGFIDKYNILKQHMTDLEIKLSEKDSQVVQLTCLVEQLKSQLSEMEEKFKNQILGLESDLKKENARVKDLRNQVTKEERTNAYLQRDVLSLKSGLEQANQVADSKKLEINSLQAELSLKVQAELKHRAELEQLQTEIHLQNSIVETLKKELEEVKSRDPALAEQLKVLSWRVKEKTNEVVALQEKIKLIEENHQSEILIMKKNMEETELMLENIRKELSDTRQEKFNYQSKVIELRKALKSKLAELESKGILTVENKYSSDGPIIHLNIPDPEVSFDEEYVNSLLQKSMKLTESRPLDHLQECLNSLKQEMVHLQQKIIDNAEKS